MIHASAATIKTTSSRVLLAVDRKYSCLEMILTRPRDVDNPLRMSSSASSIITVPALYFIRALVDSYSPYSLGATVTLRASVFPGASSSTKNETVPFSLMLLLVKKLLGSYLSSISILVADANPLFTNRYEMKKSWFSTTGFVFVDCEVR